MTYLKRLIYILSLLFILLASLVVFLFTTTPGLYTTLNVANLFIPGKLSLQKGSGRLGNHFAFNKLIYEEGTLRIEIRKGQVDWHWKNLFKHQLTITDLNASMLVVNIKPPSHPIPKLPFTVQLNNVSIKKIKIQQPEKTSYFNELQLNAWFNKQEWEIRSLRTSVANFNFTIRGKGSSVAPFSVSGNVDVVHALFSPQTFKGHLSFEGDSSLYRWQGEFKGLAHGNIKGSLTNGEAIFTEIAWHDMRWNLNKNKVLKSSEGRLTIEGILADYIVNIKTRIDSPIATDWEFKATIKDKQQTNLHSILHLSDDPLKTTLVAKGVLEDITHAKFTVTVNPGVYKFASDSPIPVLPFKGGDVLIDIDPKGLQAQGVLTIAQQKSFNLNVRIPNFRLDNIAATAKTIDGKLNLQLQSANFLEGLSKAGERLAGQLQIALIAKGALNKPTLSGELSFTNGSLAVPKSGLVFSPITAKLKSSNNRWQAQGTVNSRGQVLTLKGQGNFSPTLTGQLSLQAVNFQIMKTRDYSINLSPQLMLTFNPSAFSVTGTIFVPSAEFKPMSFSNTMNLSEDVVFVHKDFSSITNPFNMNTDIEIKMGQDVVLDVKGLHGFLDGAIRVKQLPHGPLSGIGELSIRDGKYKAYGQDLIVDDGELLFTGGPIDNPSIRLRAIRKFSSNNSNAGSTQLLDFSAGNLDTVDIAQETTVGIELSGRLNAHKIKLFSIPPTLSQSDILSMLILGKPASQASASGGQLLLAAISSMNLDSGTKGLQLIDQLKQSLGVDFNLQNNPRYAQGTNQFGDGTALVVGKSLSKRLYVSYNVGLLQTDSNVLTLKYLLNKFFSIQVTASDSGSGLDLLYTHSKN